MPKDAPWLESSGRRRWTHLANAIQNPGCGRGFPKEVLLFCHPSNETGASLFVLQSSNQEHHGSWKTKHMYVQQIHDEAPYPHLHLSPKPAPKKHSWQEFVE
jgi:hypothetical protein